MSRPSGRRASTWVTTGSPPRARRIEIGVEHAGRAEELELARRPFADVEIGRAEQGDRARGRSRPITLSRPVAGAAAAASRPAPAAATARRGGAAGDAAGGERRAAAPHRRAHAPPHRAQGITVSRRATSRSAARGHGPPQAGSRRREAR